jgi:hypothetical protein
VVRDHKELGTTSIYEIEIEFAYNNTSINRMLSLGPPCYANYFGAYKREIDREPLIPTSPLAVRQ